MLDQSNREIFISALEYFFDDDVNFLNIDAVYDESERYFSHLVSSLRNNSYALGERYLCLGEYFYSVKINAHRPFVSPFVKSHFMIFIDIWYYLMIARLKSVNVKFNIGNNSCYVHSISGKTHTGGFFPQTEYIF